MSRVCEILGIEKPVVHAPMLWLTSPELVAAVSNAGGLGVIGVGAGSTEPEATREATNEAFRTAVRRVKELTDRPFGVNLMTAASDPNGHNADTIAIMKEEGVAVVVLVGDVFADGEIAALKADGFKVVARQLNPTVAGAKRLEELGADAIVATGCDEGGVMPAGATGTMAMVALMSEAVDIPVLAAGGIVNEKFARASAVLGAEGAFAGTRFILSEECRAAQATKQDLLDASADDMVTITVWGGGGRWRTTPTAKAVAAAQANMAGDLNPDQGDYRKSELLGQLDEGINSASSVVSLVKSIDSCSDIVADLARGYE
ncbi:Nitronate monooxygenase [Slackia heliotrinireducens]|uniref:2-nitropropane dioxygenase-like enzyme n=1 Tax=Slackia heliotrinireducens (strain ATCC 29202 / DSM 20476 / NCTC 11029 / RHS 1) TaxID=471855 RepID=C7N2E7_SLAHD|nr:nitronate monooxygenase [Slackia heliotrinireducens]ACV21453.1 2-nitropropane dioxygenase-like enzyme [Slackia heliotrinireducens DSM 20476]VEG98892.1 Nitronate monooxygenase [Slackia heliotrinireducens]